MQAVMAFAAKGKAALAAKTAGGQAAGASGKMLGNMSRGLSVLGSLSEYAGQRQRAAALDQDARDEAMAGRQEYVRAAEQVSAIDAEFNSLVGSQLTTAAAMGIDVASGSVVAARETAQADADRERGVIRRSAETNAAMRRLRSVNLRQAAKNVRFGSTVKLGLDVAQAFV